MCLTGATGSTWAQRETCIRFELSDVARPPNEVSCLNAVSARPWDGSKCAKDVRVVLLDVSPPAAMAEAEAIGMTRRLYINKVDIMKHWLTEGCLGCSSFAEGEGAQGHSEGCRARLEAEIARESA